MYKQSTERAHRELQESKSTMLHLQVIEVCKLSFPKALYQPLSCI